MGVIAIDFQSLHFVCVSTNSLHVIIMHVIFSLLGLSFFFENLAGNFLKLSCEIVEIVRACLLRVYLHLFVYLAY